MAALVLGSSVSVGFAALAGAQDQEPARPAQSSRDGESLSQGWAREFAAFRDASLSVDERYGAIRRAYELCYDWIRAHPAPFSAVEQADLEALRRAMALGERLASGYIDPDRVITIHRAWFKSLVVHCADGLNETMFAEELTRRVRFVLRHEPLAALESLLTDDALERIESTDSGDSVSEQRVIRADARRTRGAFRGALEDLEIARARLLNDEGEMSAHGRGAYEAVSFKVAVDLGLLDRASVSLKCLQELTTGKAAGSFERQRFQLALARYHQAHGRFDRVLAAADELLPEGLDAANLKVALTDHEARALVLRALALSKLARTSAEQSSALGAIRLEQRRSGTDEASRVPLEIELVAILQGSQSEEDQEEARSIATSILSRLESERSSTLFAARAAVQLYALVEEMGRRDEVERARLVLEDSAAQLVRSWREIGRVDGGIGFLDFPERLEVASAWISCRLNSPGGAEYALQGMLEIDGCSQLAQRIAERYPDSPALELEVDDLVAFVRSQSSALVWFLPAPDCTHRFTVSASGVDYAALEPISAFAGPFERITAWLRRRPAPGPVEPMGPKMTRELEWLAQELLPAPFHANTAAPKGSDPAELSPLPSLWLAGLGPFGHAPFEILPGASGRPLALTVPVVRLPSLTCAVRGAMAVNEGLTKKEKGTFAIFSPPMKDHPNGDISLRIEEIMALREAGDGHTRFSLTRGPAATRQGFARALGSGAELFVAWTHGRYKQALDRPAGLDVSNGGAPGFDFLDARFVESVLETGDATAIPRAVYLAACDVARGHRRTGDAGASHLGGAFLGSGVPVVIASGERNDREATSVHLEAFSRAFLTEGATAEVAMLRARSEVASRAEFAHPHFWGGLQLLGWGPTRSK